MSSMLLPFSLSEDQKCKGHENYASWKINMIAHGKPRGLLNYWENKITVPESLRSKKDNGESSPSQPPPSTEISLSTTTQPTPVHSRTPNELEYELRESVALSSILINLSDIARSGINPDGTSHEAWEYLSKKYRVGSQRLRNTRERELAECRYVDGNKVAGEGGHIEKMRMMRKAANDVGADITDERFIVKLLESFPESWDPIVSTLYGETDLVKVIQILTTHGERIANRSNKYGLGAPTATADTVKALEATIQALQAQVNGLLKKANNNSDKKCSNCKKTGHIQSDCFQEGGGKQGQYPTWWKGKRTVSPPAATFTSTTTDGADVRT